MTEAEINAAFGGTSETSPIWLAVTELLQREVDEAVQAAASPGRTDADRQYFAGGLYSALLTRHKFMDRMRMMKNA